MLRIVFCDDNKEFLKVFSKTVCKELNGIFDKNTKCTVGPLFDSAKTVLEYLKTDHADVLFSGYRHAGHERI